MKEPTVYQAHTICDAVKARAVIVIALDDADIKASSYGETKALCQQAAYTLDCLVDAITDGRIPVWATAESEARRMIALDKERIRKGIEEGTHCRGCQMPRADCDCDDRMTAAQYDEGSDDV